MTIEEKFIQYLALNNQRYTHAKKRILRIIMESEEHIHLDDLISGAKGHDISRITVLRTLRQLIDAGLLFKLFDEHQRVHYEISFKREHHAHLICVGCGEIIEIQCPVDNCLVQDLCNEKGFRENYHVFKIFGTCGKCN